MGSGGGEGGREVEAGSDLLRGIVVRGLDARWSAYEIQERNARRYSSNCRRMNSSEPLNSIVDGLDGLSGSHVSVTVWVRKSIQRRSAAVRLKADRSDDEVMLIVRGSSRLIRMSLYLSRCCSRSELVDPTI